MGFPGSSAGKESAWNAGDLGLIPGLGRSPGERNGYPLQYSGLENSMDCIAHGVTKSQIWLSDFHFSCTFSSNSKSKGNPWHEEILVLLTVYVTLHPTPKQQKTKKWDFPGGPGVKTSHRRGTQVQSLVRELRPHTTWHGPTKQTKLSIQKMPFPLVKENLKVLLQTSIHARF